MVRKIATNKSFNYARKKHGRTRKSSRPLTQPLCNTNHGGKMGTLGNQPERDHYHINSKTLGCFLDDAAELAKKT